MADLPNQSPTYVITLHRAPSTPTAGLRRRLAPLHVLIHFISPGSRYIYDLYYEKEAISKQLYDWLLKNNYADANLIAKWKKQGYEKVRCAPRPTNCRRGFFPPSTALRIGLELLAYLVPFTDFWISSCVVFAVSRRKRRISTPPASAVCPKRN